MMNKQKSKTHHGIEWTDYTWNPIVGCSMGCSWIMPDGKEAICYAESQANKFSTHFGSFKTLQWHPERLQDPYNQKAPSKIFVGSMADIFQGRVTRQQIEAMIKVFQDCHWHTFQLLTKNPRLAVPFEFPPNVWVGISMPPTKFNSTAVDQKDWFQGALDTLHKINAKTRFINFEPLSYDIASDVEKFGIDWAIIGAASNGRTYYQPDPEHLVNLVTKLDDEKTPIFYKGNITWTPSEWREEFPCTRITEE